MSIRNLACLSYFLFMHCIIANAESFDNEKIYNSDELYYLSVSIPEDIRRINYHAISCDIVMSSFFLGNSDSLSKKEVKDIVSAKCSFLVKNINAIKLKYKNDKKSIQLLSMADDTSKIYHAFVNR